MVSTKISAGHAEFNRRWAAVLLETLVRHGVRDICIAPGSRSTPLTLEAAANDRLTCHTHFDERGLGHFALGIAKASHRPVAVIVTSGTAAANLYPALIEASLSGERLVLLTADRPPEQIDCGANQAIRQNHMFADHPTCTINLPRPTPDIPAAWLTSVVDEAMAQTRFGALHINCPFAEPLYGEKTNIYHDWSDALGAWWHDHQPWLRMEKNESVAQQSDWQTWRAKKGVVVAGKMSAKEDARIAEWAQQLGWPLLADILSQTGQPLPHADLWLANEAAQNILQQAEIVVQFGSRLTGKRLLQWQASCTPKEYWLIAPQPRRLDPAHHCSRRLVADISEWLAAHPAATQKAWATPLPQLAAQAKICIEKQLGDNLSEALLAHRLAELLPKDGQLFLGNSLILRLIDALAQLPVGYPAYANRGASGIDGLVSTAAGVARAAAKPTLAVIGDLSALYDLNSLALLRKTSAPFTLIVVNNNGGGIFSLLPTPESERENYYCMPHDLGFSNAAEMFGIHYAAPENWMALKNAVQKSWQQDHASLIELRLPKSEGAETLQALLRQIQQS